MAAPLWLGFSLTDWLILAGLAVVIALSRVWARRHPKYPPGP